MLHDHVGKQTDIQAQSLNVSETVNLDRLLLQLYPKKFVATAKVHNLEVLTALYQKASVNRSTTAQAELRRRIFHILGIRFGVDETFMPSIVPEAAQTLFQFYSEGAMLDGLCRAGKIYGKVETAPLPTRSSLDQISLMFSEQKISCVITVTTHSYSLWLPLRSPVYAIYLKQGIAPIKKALALHSSLCRFKQAKSAA